MFEFVLGGNGTPLVRVTIVENGAGSFTFTLEQIGSGAGGAWQTGDLKGELRGLFFDVDGNASGLSLTNIILDEGRSYSGLTGAVTTGGAGQNDVTGFTKTNSDVNMNGAGLPSDGGYDVGVAIGTSGVGAKGDDVQGVTFTLTGLSGITLEDLANQDFGIRMMSIGVVDANEAFIGSRDGSAKIVGDSGDIVTNEAPVATAASASGDEDATSIAVTLTGTDSDGTVASVRLTSLPSDGLLYTDALLTTLAATGVDYAGNSVTFYFVPDANFNGQVTFDFTVTDNDGATDATPATATITVDAVNDAPEGTDNTIATDEDTPYIFTAADFGFDDPVEGDDLLAVKISTLPGNGTLFLSGVAIVAGDFISKADIDAGNLTFEPTENANGTPYDSFTFQVQDDGGTGNGGVDLDQSANTITVNVDAVNDAPAGTDKTVTTDEDTAHVFSASDFGFSDPVEGDDLLAVKISTLPTNGSLLLNGLAVSAGDFIAVADINDGKLTFEPAANANGAPYSDFTFQVQDDGGTANGGVDLDQSANTITVNVNAVNDAPAGTDNTVATNEDTAYVFTAADFGFSDPVEGDDLLAVKIGTLPVKGALLLNGLAVSAGDFIAVADINDGKLTLAPAANANGDDYASFTFQVQDDGGTANGGVDLDQSANTMTIDVTSVNDEPAGANNTVTTDEDTAYIFVATDFGFTDPVDSPANNLAAVKISTLPLAGVLELNGLAVSAGDFVAVADINDGKLTFTPAANANGDDYASFTFQVQDDGGTANGGVNLDQSANTLIIDVTAVNDAPVNAVPSAKSAAQAVTTAIAGVSVSDVDLGSSPIKITLSAEHGNLALGSVLGLTFSDAQGDHQMVFTGLLADVNNALATLSYTGDSAFSGGDAITLISDDQGATGTGGAKTDTDLVAVTVIVDPNNNDDKTGTNDATKNDDTLVGTSVVDTISGQGGDDTIFGLAGNDNLNGNGDNDIIYGGSGDDVIAGNDGLDKLYGGSGNDTITGGNDNDTIVGGFGNDAIQGGNATDTIVYLSLDDGKDTIGGFNTDVPTTKSGDVLDISAVLDLADSTWTDGQNLAFAISNGFVSLTNSGGNTLVSVDIDGNAGSLFQSTALAVLTGVDPITAATTLADNIVLD